MRIHVEDDKEFELLLDSFSSDVVSAGIHHRLLKDLWRSVTEYERELNQATAFWSLTFQAHLDAVLFRLCRIYDQHKTALSLRNFLQTIQKYAHLFDEAKFRERLRGNKFVDSLAESAKKPDEVQLSKDISSVDSSHSSVDLAVKKLVELRHGSLAHRDPKFVLSTRSSEVLEPLSFDEIDHVLDLATGIINRYSYLFRASVYSIQIVGHDDYLSVLNAVREGYVRREQEIENEIKALGSRR